LSVWCSCREGGCRRKGHDSEYARLLPVGVLEQAMTSSRQFHGVGHCRTFAEVKAEVARFMRRFRSGIFVSFRASRVSLFQPFSDHVHRNNMVRVESLTRETRRLIRRRADWLRDPRTWYVNHCWVDNKRRRRHTPTEWFATEYLYFLEQVAATFPGGLPDLDVIINDRDFPLCPKSRRPPHIPVLSCVTHPEFRDPAFPTPDDIETVTAKVFLHLTKASTCRDTFAHPFEPVPWEQRQPTAVFRGIANGCGVDHRTNPRIRLAWMGRTRPELTGGTPPLLDVGIVKIFDAVPRVDPGSGNVTVMTRDHLLKEVGGEVPAIPLHQQSRFRYILNVEGYVGAFRYLHMLASGSVVLNVACLYQMWYEPAIQPWKHIVPVSSVDGVPDAVLWCRSHDGECQRIARDAKTLHTQLASMETLSAYVITLLRLIAKAKATKSPS
jgi:hypothetical protein